MTFLHLNRCVHILIWYHLSAPEHLCCCLDMAWPFLHLNSGVDVFTWHGFYALKQVCWCVDVLVSSALSAPEKLCWCFEMTSPFCTWTHVLMSWHAITLCTWTAVFISWDGMTIKLINSGVSTLHIFPFLCLLCCWFDKTWLQCTNGCCMDWTWHSSAKTAAKSRQSLTLLQLNG